jgi:hypothetical protein
VREDRPLPAEYAAAFGSPVIEGVMATRLRRDRKGRYLVDTTHGELIADHYRTGSCDRRR